MNETRPQALAGSQPPILLPTPRLISPGESDVVTLTAYALAAATQDAPTAEAVEAKRQDATRLLTDHAFRTLHNELTRLRREAVDEYLAAHRGGPSIWAIIGASTMALLLSSVLLLWVLTEPTRLAALVVALGR